MIDSGWISLARDTWEKATTGQTPPAASAILFKDAADALPANPEEEPDFYKLLHWDTRYAKLLPGRDAEMLALRKWAFDKHGFHIGILTGPGGAGKTRLAAEFCDKLAQDGWTSGFLRALPPENAPVWLGGSFCFVIDYPEEKGELLRNMLQRLRSWLNDGKERDVRILLLARENSEQQLRNILDDADFVHEVSHLGLTSLQPLQTNDALALSRQVIDAVSGKNHCFADSLPELKERLPQWLQHKPDTHGLPLFIIAATLHGLMQPEESFTLGGQEVLAALARREIRRARRISNSINLAERALPRLLGLAVLAGGLDGAAIARLRGQQGLGGDALNEDDLRATPWWDGEQNRLMLHAPDRAATAFLATALLDGAHEHDLPQWLWLALQNVAETFARELPRLLWDLLNFDRKARERLQQALQEMIGNDPEPPRRALAFEAITTMQNHLSAPLAISIGKVLVAHASDDSSKAEALNNLANSLSRLGHHEEALKAAQEAASIYRQLAGDNPQAFKPDLAASLNNLANRLSDMDRHKEALKPAQEAADIYCKLAKDNPQAFRPHLATSLNNLAIRLSDMDHHEKALEQAREAVNIHRQLAGNNPQAFEPDLAMSLNNLANSLSKMGRHEEALEAAQEAADIYRQLAEDNPQAFAPDLARSYGTLGMVRLHGQQAMEAANAFAEGLRIIAPHAQALPQAHGPLAVALLQAYLQACEAAGTEPDAQLLAPLGPVLQALQGE